MKTAVGNFLKFNDILIIPFLIDTYIDNDLSKFVPKTDVEILKKFENDFENNLFLKLEKSYLVFT